jgi:hypothetical protein
MVRQNNFGLDLEWAFSLYFGNSGTPTNDIVVVSK